MTEPKRYTGTKVVLASPMTRAAYNEYRGWQLPANEDGSDAGFLVEYMDGGQANDSRHAGYISWSPVGVFENSYRERPFVEPDQPLWKQRVMDESADLDEKISKLATFLQSPGAHVATDSVSHDLLRAQHRTMLEYSDILVRRLSLVGDGGPTSGQVNQAAAQRVQPARDEVEAEILAKGLTAPRVTPIDIENNIASEHYFTADEGNYGHQYLRTINENGGVIDYEARKVTPDALKLLTICILTLRNGFTVLGTSACASPENFDAGLGRKIARADAAGKVWPLMGYALREKLHQAS